MTVQHQAAVLGRPRAAPATPPPPPLRSTTPRCDGRLPRLGGTLLSGGRARMRASNGTAFRSARHTSAGAYPNLTLWCSQAALPFPGGSGAEGKASLRQFCEGLAATILVPVQAGTMPITGGRVRTTPTPTCSDCQCRNHHAVWDDLPPGYTLTSSPLLGAVSAADGSRANSSLTATPRADSRLEPTSSPRSSELETLLTFESIPGSCLPRS